MSAVAVPDKTTLDIACNRLDLPEISRQESRYLLSRFRGLTQAVSARAAGLDKNEAVVFEQTEQYHALLDYLHIHSAEATGITRDRLNIMLLDAHDLAATSGERVSAIRELGQLNDLYPNKQTAAIQINQQINQVSSDKEIQRFSDEQLLELAGMTTLEPASDN